METIYDHNPTADELRYISGAPNAEQYRLNVTEDEALYGLAQLFALRGDGPRSEAYARRMSDPDSVQMNWLNGDYISPTRAIKKPSSQTKAASNAA
jgi:hypothetical protein